jgi:hypothetical protein
MASTLITQGFEELMGHTNVLNRKLEEVYGVGKEFTTVAELWGVSAYSFYLGVVVRYSQVRGDNLQRLVPPGIITSFRGYV